MQDLVAAWQNKRWRQIAGIALLAAGISLFSFSPRFAYWRLLSVPLPVTTSEVIRAQAALVQLADPTVQFTDDTNRVLNWRLFFPWFGYLLHLPPKVFLALPHAGAALAVLFVAWLARKQTVDLWTAAALTTLAATCSWFFVSTGWLGYFDSWLVLGALLIVFAPDWRAGLVALLVTPWIDERIIFVLPLLYFLRQRIQSATPASVGKQNDRHLLTWMAGGIVPWLLFRTGSLFLGHDATSRGYVGGLIARQSVIRPGTYLLGVWQGIRFCWVPLAAWLAIEWRDNRWRAASLSLLLFATLLVNVFIATDVSRSMSVFLPAALVGALLWLRARPDVAARSLVVLCALNLITPAMHVSGNAAWPIRYFYSELDAWREPPPARTSVYYIRQAAAYRDIGKIAEALRSATIAIDLGGDNPEAYHLRATLFARLNTFREALADASEAVRLEPANPLFRNDRACLRARQADYQGAIADFEQVLREPTTDETLRAQATASLAGVRGLLPPAR